MKALALLVLLVAAVAVAQEEPQFVSVAEEMRLDQAGQCGVSPTLRLEVNQPTCCGGLICPYVNGICCPSGQACCPGGAQCLPMGPSGKQLCGIPPPRMVSEPVSSVNLTPLNGVGGSSLPCSTCSSQTAASGNVQVSQSRSVQASSAQQLQVQQLQAAAQQQQQQEQQQQQQQQRRRRSSRQGQNQGQQVGDFEGRQVQNITVGGPAGIISALNSLPKPDVLANCKCPPPCRPRKFSSKRCPARPRCCRKTVTTIQTIVQISPTADANQAPSNPITEHEELTAAALNPLQ